MLSNKLINELSRNLSGFVLEPGDSRYEAARQIDNGRIRLRPGLIVFPTTVQDVALALKFARDNDLPFTVKGGGHSAAGYCLNDDGVVLDMIHLNDISFDPAKPSVTVQMGARWSEVYQYMEDTETGLIPVGGGCPTVGIAGFMLGGGYSFVSRTYGMSIDNLLSVTIVTADGTIRRVGRDSTAEDDKDLFWACCGGGGGNFGIAAEMEMLVREPRSRRMLVGQIRFELERAEDVIGYYNEWVETLPDEMAVYGYWGQQPNIVHPGERIKVLGLTPAFNGPFAEGMDYLKDILKLAPLSAAIHDMTLPEWEAYNGAFTLVRSRSAYMRSLILKPLGMTTDIAKTFVKYIDTAPSPDSFAVWTHGGGEISKRSADETAFPHREARFIPQVKAIWEADRPGDARENVLWAHEFFEALSADATGAYVNYIDPLLHDWPEKYYRNNYERLVRIKQRVDPDNFFKFQQSIGSTFNHPAPPLADLSPLNRTI